MFISYPYSKYCCKFIVSSYLQSGFYEVNNRNLLDIYEFVKPQNHYDLVKGFTFKASLIKILTFNGKNME